MISKGLVLTILSMINTASTVYPKILVQNFVILSTILCAFMGWCSGLVDGYGLLIFGLFTGCSSIYFNPFGLFSGPFFSSLSYNSLSHNSTHTSYATKAVHGLALLFIVIIFFGVLHHKLPGFHNVPVLLQHSVSPNSIPFNLWFNFDRNFLAMVLYMYGMTSVANPYRCLEKQDRKAIEALVIIIFVFVACISLITALALSVGYIEWDIKWPSITGLWAVNNLFFTCFVEEVWFRWFLQGQIKRYFAQYSSKRMMRYGPHILASALFFGVDHAIKGGLIYGVLALVAGLFYGYIYDRTGRISYTCVFHFLLNALHFVLFTYPASNSMVVQ